MFSDPSTSLERYFDLCRRGDYAAALEAARAVAVGETQAPEPYYAIGEALAALGRHTEASAAFVEAVRRAPGWVDAWVNLGIARYRLGRIHQAKLAFRQALRLAPGHAAATSNLAALMRISGESEASERLLDHALADAPDNHAARLNIVAEHLQTDRGAEALAILDSAPSRPQTRDLVSAWRLARSLALIQLRRLPEASAEVDAIESPAPAEIAPLVLWRRILLSELCGEPARAEALAGEMELALDAMGPSEVREHRLIGHYDLAKFYAARGDFARAFGHWSAGHALLKIMQPFSRAAAQVFIEAQIATFDAARFAGPRSSLDVPTPVFIVGLPRSGTTLCEAILDAHRQVHGAGERNDLARTFGRLGGAKAIAAMEASDLDLVAADYLAALHALAPAAAHIVDKMPGNELYLGLVGLMLPGAKIIHCVRDPRDIGLSIWTHRFYGEHAYAHDLGDLGWTIAARARLVAHWRAVLPNPILTIALGDWVRDFEGTLSRALAFLNLPHDDNCARFYESDRKVRTASRAQVRQPVNARGLGRWRAFETQLAPMIEELRAGGMLAGEA